jgi:hypothetical protein
MALKTHAALLLLLCSGAGCSVSHSFVDASAMPSDPARSVTVRLERSHPMLGASIPIYVVEIGSSFAPNGILYQTTYGIGYFEAPDGIHAGNKSYLFDHPGGHYKEIWIYNDEHGRHEVPTCPGGPVTVIGTVGNGSTLEWKRPPGYLHSRLVSSASGFSPELWIPTKAGEKHVLRCGMTMDRIDLEEVP